ncbi:MAG TPA: hypothetical protein VF141_03735 [Chryseolinea sp.]
MENRGADKLRSLLKRFEIQAPPTFRGEVMREIEAMADDEVYAGARLKAMLKKNAGHSPSTEFTYQVLNQVRGQSRAAYPPIIPKRTWALIVTFLVICVAVALVKDPLGGNTSVLRYLSVGDYLGNLTLRFVEPLFYSAVIIVSAGLLLVLDHFINKRLRSRPAAED